MYLALKKCKNDCKILWYSFCPLKPEIARFSIGFLLNTFLQGRLLFVSGEPAC